MKSGDGGEAQATDAPRMTLVSLAVLLFAEAALALVFAGWHLVVLLGPGPVSLPTGIGLLVLGLAAAAWGVATAIGMLAAKPWSRGSAVTWQVLQGAVAIGCFQGLYLDVAFGVALLVGAIVGIVLALVPATGRALGVDEPRGTGDP